MISFTLTQVPNNLFAEEAVLNILLLNPLFLKNISSTLKAKSFYDISHQYIFEGMIQLLEKNRNINITNLISILQEKGLFEKIGGIEKIAKILNKYENPLELENYINILNEKYLRRILIEFGKEIVKLSYNSSENLENILEKLEEKIFYLNQEKTFQKTSTAAEIIDEVFAEIKLKINKNEMYGYSTSFRDLDAILQGFQSSDLIIIAGRPSMGKTAFALNIGKNLVEQYNLPLIIFSLEMSRQQIIYRFLSSESNINSSRLKSGKMTTLEWQKLTDSMKKLSKFSIFIDDNPNVTLSEIRIIIKRITQNKKKNGFVIIDYLQLMKTNLKGENRVQEISYLTRNLKILAKEFEIPILLLSQLSRNVESRVNKKPMLSDLRESGCLAQFSNNTVFTWNKASILHFNKLIHFNYKGKKPIYIITLENDKKLFLTANHKVFSNKGWIRVSELQKNYKIYGYEKIINLTRVKFYQIKKIEYEKFDIVFDKTIPLFHNYFQESVLIHNSIEQDADIVLMIYREDYYNEKKLFPQITDILISKHRNGSVGSAKLLFNSYTTTFENAKNRT